MSLAKFAPWKIEDGKYKIKFSWKADQVVPIVDSKGLPSQARFAIALGLVKIAFKQKPYVQPDAIGTSVKLVGIQVIQASGSAGVADAGDLNEQEVAALFGKPKASRSVSRT